MRKEYIIPEVVRVLPMEICQGFNPESYNVNFTEEDPDEDSDEDLGGTITPVNAKNITSPMIHIHEAMKEEIGVSYWVRNY